jgi:hypothetical protein
MYILGASGYSSSSGGKAAICLEILGIDLTAPRIFLNAGCSPSSGESRPLTRPLSPLKILPGILLRIEPKSNFPPA